MKSNKKLILITGTLFFLLSVFSETNGQQGNAETYKVFYDNLSAYGKWIKDPAYGYVWAPKVEKGFRPYFTNGSWKMTEFGTTWISNYPWGWAAFHYGRWLFDSFYGWVWLPGSEWGPAWVVWRADAKNYTWTPLIPGYTISQALGPDYHIPDDRWVFIPAKYLLNTSFQKFAKSNVNYNKSMLKGTHIVKNTNGSIGYISGHYAENYAGLTGINATVYGLKHAPKPGKAIINKEQISLCKPVIKKWESGNEPVPANFTKASQPIGKPAALGSSIGGAQASAKTKTKKGKK